MPPEVFEEFLNCNSGLVPVLCTVNMELKFFSLGCKGTMEKNNLSISKLLLSQVRISNLNFAPIQQG